MQFIPRQDINANATFPGSFAMCAVIPTLRRLITLSQNNIMTQKLPPYHSHVGEIGLPVLFVRRRAHEHNPADFSRVRKWFIIGSQTSWCAFAALVDRWYQALKRTLDASPGQMTQVVAGAVERAVLMHETVQLSLNWNTSTASIDH